jgi:hypothetical protein
MMVRNKQKYIRAVEFAHATGVNDFDFIEEISLLSNPIHNNTAVWCSIKRTSRAHTRKPKVVMLGVKLMTLKELSSKYKLYCGAAE